MRTKDFEPWLTNCLRYCLEYAQAADDFAKQVCEVERATEHHYYYCTFEPIRAPHFLSKLSPVDGARVLLTQLRPLDEKYVGEVVEQPTGKRQPVDAAVRLDKH